MILSLTGIETFYGNIQALRGVSLEVQAGEIVALIGANGAGKSTLLMTICGNPQPRAGSIKFKGEELVGQSTSQIMRHGIAQVPEGRRIFPKMSVLENLTIGATLADPKFFASDLDAVFGIFPILHERQQQRAGTLSGGEQQMLAIGRALMSRPELLLLDEPSLGIAPLIIKQIFSTIQMLNRERKNDHPADRTECAPGAEDRPPRLCPATGRNRHERPGSRDHGRPAHPSRLSWRDDRGGRVSTDFCCPPFH